MDGRHGRHADPRPWYRQPRAWVTVALAAVSVTVFAAVATGSFGSSDDPSPATPTAGTQAPDAPPARVCGNAEVLDGPERPPRSAVVVRTADDLSALTREHPPGTTFWLEPGTHRLPPEEFAQVQPKDGNTYVGAPGAVLDGGRQNRYAFAGQAREVTIAHLTVQAFGPLGSNNDAGVVNHDSATDWTVYASTLRDNAGAGLMLGSGGVVRDSCLQANGQYGFNAYHPDGVVEVTLLRNEITGNNTDDWERRRPGCGCTGGGKFWAVSGATVADNWIHDNNGAGLWADTNNHGFALAGNYVEDNAAEGLIYETSYNASVRDNTFVRNGLVKGPSNPGFPTAAVFVSESGSDDRVPGPYATSFDIEGNVFVDNWSGVVLWENADRFAGSPSNTSTGSSTLVNPDVVTAQTCNEQTIADEPYVDDCRWKTQNVTVTGNVFRFTPGKVGPSCGATSGCGYNGLFSNWGSWPPWSPYHGRVVEDRITFEQNNRFTHNTYVGPWRFVVHEQGNVVTFEAWRAEPYGQDESSTLR